MDADQKKAALRMIPYGLYVITGKDRAGRVTAATINWVTQASFEPPLIAVGVKVDSSAHEVIKDSGTFALNVLSKAQQGAAFAFFKTVEAEGNSIGGEEFTEGSTGSPVLKSVPAYVECNLVDTVERGDHSIFVGEVVDAGVSDAPEGRLDSATLMLGDLGDKVYYGG